MNSRKIWERRQRDNPAKFHDVIETTSNVVFGNK